MKELAFLPSDCLAEDMVGVCDVQLIQYDAATLALRNLLQHQKRISSHDILKTQKQLYTQLQPQQSNITEMKGLLSPQCALTYRNTSIDSIFDFSGFQKSKIQVWSYDLSCSFAINWPYRYALIFSNSAKQLQQDSYLNSIFKIHQKNNVKTPSWLSASDTSRLEESIFIVLFSQKRKRKLWKQALKDTFGCTAMNLQRSMSLDQSPNFNVLMDTLVREKLEQHQQQQQVSQKPPKKKVAEADATSPLQEYPQRQRPQISKPTVHDDNLTPFSHIKSKKQPFKPPPPPPVPKHVNIPDPIDTPTKPKATTVNAPSPLLTPPSSLNSSSSNTSYTPTSLSTSTTSSIPIFTPRTAANSTKFLAVNVTPPLQYPEQENSHLLSPSTPKDKPKKGHSHSNSFSNKLSLLLGNGGHAKDDDDSALSELSVALKSPLMPPPTPKSTSISEFSNGSGTFPTMTSNISSQSGKFLQTLDTWYTGQSSSLPSLVSDTTTSSPYISSTTSLSTNSTTTSAAASSLTSGPTNVSGSGNIVHQDNSSLEDPMGLNIRWNASSPPISPYPPKYRLPKIPEIPERTGIAL